MCILTVILAAYCCYAIVITGKMAKVDMLRDFEIVLADSSRFVNADDVRAEIGFDADSLRRTPRTDFDMAALERHLKASDKLQDARVNMTNRGNIRITVEPVVPVARVFEPGKKSYYINAGGKVISAELRYHIDVPVLVGEFDSVYPAKRLLPLLDKISASPALSAITATVTQEKNGNIIIVPTIVGHVINFGDTSMVDDKFSRLLTFYRRVAPGEGWNMYDTVSVKWRGRIVANRRHKAPEPFELPTMEEQSGELDIDGNDLDEAAELVVNAKTSL